MVVVLVERRRESMLLGEADPQKDAPSALRYGIEHACCTTQAFSFARPWAFSRSGLA